MVAESDSMAVCASSSESIPDPQEQAPIIQDLADQTPLKAGDTWYLICSQWYRKWKEYCRKNLLSVQNPDCIDQSRLLVRSDSGQQELKKHLIETINYTLVCEPVWNKLVEWYGCLPEQPVLAREVVMIGHEERVEIYPLVLKAALYDDLEREIQVTVSKSLKAADLTVKLRSLFDIEDNKTARVWDWKSSLVMEDDEEVGVLFNHNKVVLEVQLNDGTWAKSETDFDDPGPTYSSLYGGGGSNTSSSSSSPTKTSSTSSYSYKGYSSYAYQPKSVIKGQTGLSNVGNTCFMNSALQCLSNTVPLTQYFLDGRYIEEINRDNPIGCEGRLAEVYADLIEELWSGKESFVRPSAFKAIIGKFAPRFMGYQQHDSQELLAFLLDGLHEDLNRILKKPYVEAKEAEGDDETAAAEAWAGHLKRNDSVIVDLFHGQLKSKLVCPICSKVSVTFDPLMYLSVPVPDKELVKISMRFVPLAKSEMPRQVSVTASKSAPLREVLQLVSQEVGVPAEHLVLKEVFQSYIYKHFDLHETLNSIQTNDVVWAFEIDPRPDRQMILMMHRTKIPHTYRDLTGDPILLSVPDPCTPRQLKTAIMDSLQLLSKDEDDELEALYQENLAKMDSSDADACGFSEELFELRYSNHTGKRDAGAPDLSQPDEIIGDLEDSTLLLQWTEEGLKKYDLEAIQSHLAPSVSRLTKTRVEGDDAAVRLDDCIELYMKEEILTQENSWRCPVCKDEVLATKQLSPWKLPEILVVHFKRFSYNSYWRDKISSKIWFPLTGLDLTKYAANGGVYDLFAVSNHLGGMGGGHYTAYAKAKTTGEWLEFDDARVHKVSEDDIVSSAAYVLFYKRRSEDVSMEDAEMKGEEEDEQEDDQDSPPMDL